MSIRTGGMNQNSTIAKILLLAALFMAPPLMAGCGAAPESESVAQSYAGPTGPTFPSSYYFDLSITPHTIQTPGTVGVTVRVWDSRGNVVANAPIIFVGPDTSTTGTTSAGGISTKVLEIKGNAGGVVFVTVTVEDSSLTLPVQIVAAVS